jgi:hypothetical protein
MGLFLFDGRGQDETPPTVITGMRAHAVHGTRIARAAGDRTARAQEACIIEQGVQEVPRLALYDWYILSRRRGWRSRVHEKA